MANNHKVKQIPVEERLELRYDDVSRRAATIARLIDRMEDGVIQVRIEKYPQKWVVIAEQLSCVQTLDLTQ